MYMYTKLAKELKANNAKNTKLNQKDWVFFRIDQKEQLYNTTFNIDKYFLGIFLFSSYQIVMKYKQFSNVSKIK